MAERSLQTVSGKIQPTDRISYLASQLGEQECMKYIRSMLVSVEQVLGEVTGLNEVVPFIREKYWDFTTEDLANITQKILTIDIFGKPNARHVIRAAELVAEEKAERLEQQHEKRKWATVRPIEDEKVIAIVKSIGKPHEVQWQQINLEDLLTLEDISGLSEQQRKQRQWVKEWFTERAAWAKSTGNKIEDYPITMETFVAQRWDELVKSANCY